MKKSTYESWVTSFIERLSEYFNLHGWTIKIEFSDEPLNDRDEGIEYARIRVSPNYLQASVEISPEAKKDFEEGDMDRLTTALLHEMVHIFLAPLHDWASPHLSETTTPHFVGILEQQTQKLTMVLVKNLPKNIFPPR